MAELSETINLDEIAVGLPSRVHEVTARQVAKAPDPDRIVQFAKSAEGAIVVERALHGSFFQRYRITPQAFAQTALSSACHHYVDRSDPLRVHHG